MSGLGPVPRRGLAPVLGCGIALWVTTAQAKPQPPVPAPKSERVVIIDLRADTVSVASDRAATRAELTTRLATMSGIEPSTDDELNRALAGDLSGAQSTEKADAALARAAGAYGKLDCAGATRSAKEAVTLLAAVQPAATSSGAAVDDKLRQAYVYLLLCAHNQGDSDAAMLAARRLSALGVGAKPPPGVSPLVWGLYPAVDATANSAIVEVRIETDPALGQVWFDHRSVGTAPVTLFVGQGEHIVAAAKDGRTAASTAIARSGGKPVRLELTGGGGRHRELAEKIAGWRSGESHPSAEGLGQLLEQLGVRFALVLSGTRQIELWARGPGDTAARNLGARRVGTERTVVEIAGMILERAGRWDRTGPDPNVTLLRERRGGKQTKKPQKWWVYATIIGAVLVGSGIILANDLADDRQRIELAWP